MQYRKKPIVIEAFRAGDLLYAAGHDWKALPKYVADAYEQGIFIFHNNHITIKTLEGDHRAEPFDMVIQGVKGEFYPCKPDIFAATYERVVD